MRSRQGTMISEMEPSYVGLLTLIVEPNVPMAKEIEDGTFTPLTPEEVMAETLLMLEHTDVSKTCVLRSNHAFQLRLPQRKTCLKIKKL